VQEFAQLTGLWRKLADEDLDPRSRPTALGIDQRQAKEGRAFQDLDL
jgi:hypothetical protein